ncbi:MAG TPA: amino acid adenylation domain-containing protein [bacterium]|nr:amino acid adenylation domain-containing protein [bacterium]
MNPAEVIAQLVERGARLWGEDGQLRCRAPQGVLTEELRTELAVHKGEILEWLRRTPSRIPLSASQEGMWFQEQLQPETSTYNVPCVLSISGPVDRSALERSINEIIRRHDALRTSVAVVDGAPVQVIAPDLWVSVPLIDLSSLPDAERDTAAARVEAGYAQRPFDLEHGPLLRASLLRLRDEHRLLLTVHHLVWDLWSLAVFLRELVALYGASRDGRVPRLPPLPAQYADFVTWQRRHLESRAAGAQLEYWKSRLRDAPAALDLPADRPRPPVPTYRGGWREFSLPPDLVRRLQSLGRSEGATLYMILLGALQTLLHRYSGQNHISVGSPTAGRQRAEFADVIGLFVSLVLLNTDVSGNPSFRTLLRRVRDVALGAYAHQDVPFARVAAALQRERGRQPVCQVVLVFDPDMLSSQLEGSGIRLRFGVTFRWTGLSDLVLFMLDTGHGLRCGWDYSTDLFDAETIIRMTGHFQTLLEAIAGDPDRPIGDLPLLTEGERRALLADGGTPARHERPPCLQDLFTAHAARTPDAVAVRDEHQSLRYGELNRRANQVAHHLRRRGVGPDVLVGLCLERSVDMVVGLLGILKAGGAYVPLDPASPRERLAFMVRDANLSLVITRRGLAAAVAEAGAAPVCLDADWAAIAREDVTPPKPGASADDLFYVVYTSGSTGRPKGVMIPHRSVSNFVLWMQAAFPLTAQDVVFQKTPFTFDISVWEVCAPWLVGARLVIARPDGHRDCRYLIDTIRAERVTQLHVVPALLQAMVEEPGIEECRSLRRVFSAGEALPRALVERVRSRLDVEVVNLYGPTEGNVDTYWVAGAHVPGEFVPIGRPIANTEAYVLDAHLQPAPIGVPGELYVGGAGLARGYLGRPDLTAERFIRHPFSTDPDARLYKTGDRGRRLPDGTFEYLGRLDDQVKLRGFRIELGEIEAVLREHPEVRDAAAVLRDDAAGEKRLLAYVVPRNGAAPNTEVLWRFLRTKLPEYMVPAAVVPLESLPLTTSGKVDRRSLPPHEIAASRPGYVAPETPTEDALARIWEAVLGVHPVGVADNFFDLGGHSLLAVRLVAAIERELGKRLPLSALFEEATVRHAAEVLLQRERENFPSPAAVIHPGGTRPPLFFLHGDYAGGGFYCHRLAEVLGPEQPLVVLHPHGLDGTPVPPSVEEMARDHLRALRAIRPHGPYHLGGYCNGGQVAFEMARRLHAQGERISLLFLVEAPLLHAGIAPRAFAILARGLGLVTRGDARAQVQFVASLRRFMFESARLPGHYRRRVAWFVASPRAERAAAVQRKGRRLRETLAALFHARGTPGVAEAYFTAILGYVPARYGGAITVMRAADSPDPRPDLGWGAVAERMDVHVTPGDHLTCVTRHVPALAGRLAACLETAHRESAATAPR